MTEQLPVPETIRSPRVVTLNELETALRRVGWEAETIELLLNSGGPPREVVCGREVLIVKK